MVSYKALNTLIEGAKVIEKEAFSECNSLKSVIIPNSVTIIEDWAFLGCCSLRSIDIPDSVTKIGVSAFLVAVLS